MSPESWENIKALFEQGMALQADSRPAWLEHLPISDEARDELKRLLELQDSAQSGFLDEPLAAVAAVRQLSSWDLEPESLLCGRYRLLRLAGSGGMGAVWEAEDLESADQRRVAVKVLLDSGQPAQSRFEREVLLARRIEHQNVCRVFGLERHAGAHTQHLFLTMEFLEGETLAQRLEREGRMQTAEVDRIGRQALAGLEAAHKLGIIHRDLKPSNIFLTGLGSPLERVVLTDFGLASQPGLLAPALTGSGDILGTLDYMAPEQLRGDSVCPRTDVYAAGLVFYEMLTGARPFARGSGIGYAAQRLTRNIPPPREIVPEIEPRWENLILACLARNPQQRPASATQVAMLLGSPPRAWLARRRSVISRRTLLITAAATLPAVSLSLALSRQWIRTGDRVQVSSVLLAPVSNHTGDPQFDGINIMLRAQLAQSAQFEVVSDDRVKDLLAQMNRPPDLSSDPPTVREIALRHGSALAIFAGLRKHDNGYALELRMEQPGSQPEQIRRTWRTTLSCAGPGELVSRVGEAAEWIRRGAGESDASIAMQNRPPEDLTTNSWAALRTFHLAQTRRKEGRPEEATTLLQEAIQTDPDFSSAHAQLADLLVSEHRYGAGYTAWARARAIASRRNLTHRERYRTEGLYLVDVQEWSQALESFRSWVARYPGDYIARYHLGSAQAALRDDDAAVAQFRECLRLSGYYGARHRLFRLHLVRGDRERAREELDGLQRSGPHSCALTDEAHLAFLELHSDRALTVLQELGTLPNDEWSGAAAYLEASVLAERGELPAAARRLEGRLREGLGSVSRPSRAEHQAGLAGLRLRLGDRNACATLCRQAIESDPGPGVIASAGTLLARSGHSEDARRAVRRMDGAPAYSTFEIARARVRGEIALADGNFPVALRELDSAAARTPAFRQTTWLAHAYARAGRPAQALAALRPWIANPAALWRMPESDPPGFVSETVALCPPGPELNSLLQSLPFLRWGRPRSLTL